MKEQPMKLAVPLSSKEVVAATRLHDRLDQWQRADRALELLNSSCPGFSCESTLLKAVAVNSLYGTNVLAIQRVAEHVCKLLKQLNIATAGPELVERIARVPIGGSEKKQIRRHSFAAKFAHFFIDSERFPIFDGYAEKMVRFHLGRDKARKDDDAPYEAYVENFHRLREVAGLRCQKRDLDHYLWIAGQYRRFRRSNHARINTELRKLFELEPKPKELSLILPDST